MLCQQVSELNAASSISDVRWPGAILSIQLPYENHLNERAFESWHFMLMIMFLLINNLIAYLEQLAHSCVDSNSSFNRILTQLVFKDYIRKIHKYQSLNLKSKNWVLKHDIITLDKQNVVLTHPVEICSSISDYSFLFKCRRTVDCQKYQRRLVT